MSKVNKFKNLTAKKSQEEPQGKAAKQMLFHDNNSVHVNENKDINKDVDKNGSVIVDINESIGENTTANNDGYVANSVAEDVNEDVNNSVHVDVHVNGYNDEGVSVDENGDTIVNVTDDTNVNMRENNNVDVSNDVYANVTTYSNTNKNKDTNVVVDINAIVSGDVDVASMKKRIKSRKTKQEPFEKRFTRRTLWVRNDLNDLLNLELENDGNITEVVNDALKLYYNMKAQGLLDDK